MQLCAIMRCSALISLPGSAPSPGDSKRNSDSVFRISPASPCLLWKSTTSLTLVRYCFSLIVLPGPVLLRREWFQLTVEEFKGVLVVKDGSSFASCLFAGAQNARLLVVAVDPDREFPNKYKSVDFVAKLAWYAEEGGLGDRGLGAMLAMVNRDMMMPVNLRLPPPALSRGAFCAMPGCVGLACCRYGLIRTLSKVVLDFTRALCQLGRPACHAR